MSTPAWNIESEYPSLTSPAFQADEAEIRSAIPNLRANIHGLGLPEKSPGLADVPTIQATFRLHETAAVLLSNIETYSYCLLSVNAADDDARRKVSEIQVLRSQMQQAMAPLNIFIQRAEDSMVHSILQDPALAGYAFVWKKERELAPYLLSPAEEVLLKAFNVPGHQAWGDLYQEITGKGKCTLKLEGGGTEVLGIAEAAAILYGPDQPKRKAAWHAIQEFWTEHRSAAAAVANALAAWRLEECQKRSHTKPKTFLDGPLSQNRISRATLDAVLETARRNLPQLRRAPRLMAKVLKKDKLDPWDLLAPSPVTATPRPRSFDEGIGYVREAFGKISPTLGDFVALAEKNRWIEGRVMPQKGGGAYCTWFPKSREPRVFQTFAGSLPDILTLAHELGHAFHSWCMRDLARPEQDYPMTLAETASVFGETTLKEYLFNAAASPTEQIEFAWSDLESITAYLINIPTRFEYEREFYERRAKGFVSADELSALMDDVWTRWYGDTLSQNEKMFWATKQHFSFADLGFYNFPYSFGYLFSLSIYARKESLGARFAETYVNILRDTGRMTAEELVMKHLGEDITKVEFWQKAVDVEIAKIDRFERLL